MKLFWCQTIFKPEFCGDALIQKIKYCLRMIGRERLLIWDKCSLDEWSTLMFWSLGSMKPLCHNGVICTHPKEYFWDRNRYWFCKCTHFYLWMTDKKDLQIGRSLVRKYVDPFFFWSTRFSSPGTMIEAVLKPKIIWNTIWNWLWYMPYVPFHFHFHFRKNDREKP